MDAIVPRYHLPDAWSGKGTCPICRTPGRLRIAHQTILPDRMECAVCGAAVEVQSGGPHIRLLTLPQALAAHAPDLLEVWLLPTEVPTIRPPAQTAVAAEPFAADLLPPASPRAAAESDAFADLGPSARPPSTGPLPTGAKPFTAPLQKEVTGSLGPAQNLGTRPLSLSAGMRPTNGSPPEAFADARPAGTAPLGPPPEPLLAGITAGSPAPSKTLASAPEPDAPTQPPAAQVPVDVTAELEDVLKLLPAQPARSDAALADELALVLAGMTTLAATPAESETDQAEPKTAGRAMPAASVDAHVAVTQPVPRVARPDGAWPRPAAVMAAEGLAAPSGSAAALAEPALATEGTEATMAAAGNLMLEAELGSGAEAGEGGAAGARPALDKARVADFTEQANKLHELGNSLTAIMAALERSRATPAEVQAAMADIQRAEAARQRRFRQTLQLVGGAALVIVLLLLAWVIVISRPAPAPGAQSTAAGTIGAGGATPGAGNAKQAPGAATPVYNPIIELINSLMPADVKIANGPSPTPGPTSPIMAVIFPPTATLEPEARATADAASGGLPDWVRNLAPAGVTVLNVPTPSVSANGPLDSACPLTAVGAGELFGGKAADWTYYGDSGGWVLIVAGNPTDIRVPANMSAGYLVIGDNLEMRSTLGPATIHNVNFAAVSCP